jgi:hypothetical protein
MRSASAEATAASATPTSAPETTLAATTCSRRGVTRKVCEIVPCRHSPVVARIPNRSAKNGAKAVGSRVSRVGVDVRS